MHVGSRVKPWRGLGVIVWLDIDRHGCEVGKSALDLRLVRKVLLIKVLLIKVLIRDDNVLRLRCSSLELACIVSLVWTTLFFSKSLAHLIKSSVNLPLIFELLPSCAVLFHFLSVLGFLHLLEELVLIGLLFLLPFVELILRDVLKHVAGLHVLDLISLG